MFRGEYNHSVDPKGRLIIPAKFRDALEGEFVITKEVNNCLSIYPMQEWEKFEEKLMNLPQKKLKIRRFFTSGANETVLDKQGRVLIPSNLRAYAEIDKDVVLIGVLNHIEIWDTKRWQASMEELQDTIEDEMEDLDF